MYYNINTRESCIDSGFLIGNQVGLDRQEPRALGTGSRTRVKNHQYPPRTAGIGLFPILSKNSLLTVPRNPESEPVKCAKTVRFHPNLGLKAYPVQSFFQGFRAIITNKKIYYLILHFSMGCTESKSRTTMVKTFLVLPLGDLKIGKSPKKHEFSK